MNKKNLLIIIITALITFIIFLLLTYKRADIQYSNDTLIVNKTDTIRKISEKIFFRYYKPRTSEKRNIDSSEFQEIKGYDLINLIEKKNNKYQIKTFNFSDSTEKEYKINSFDKIISSKNGLIIKEDKYYWKGISLESEFSKSYSENKSQVTLKFTTGINYKGIIDFNILTYYNINEKKFFWGFGFRFNIIR